MPIATPSLRITLRLTIAASILSIASGLDAQTARPKPTPIHFARGATSASIPVALRPGESQREYGIYALVGQTMTVSVAARGAPAAFSVSCPGCHGAGASFHAFSQGGRWSGALPASGGYVIRLASTTPGQQMTLTVAIAAANRHTATRPAAPTPATAAHPATPPAAARPVSPATANRPTTPPAVARPVTPATPSTGSALPTPAAATSAVPEPLHGVLGRLRSRSGVPILLPGEIPAGVEKPLYAMATGDANGYRVTLTHAPGCDADACVAGYVDAERGRRPGGPQRVRLADGTTAFFTPMSCGASCSEPRIEWERNGVVYGIELGLPGQDAEHRAVLMRLAASAMRAGPR